MLITVDGQKQKDKIITLLDDQVEHQVKIVLYSLSIPMPVAGKIGKKYSSIFYNCCIIYTLESVSSLVGKNV